MHQNPEKDVSVGEVTRLAIPVFVGLRRKMAEAETLQRTGQAQRAFSLVNEVIDDVGRLFDRAAERRNRAGDQELEAAKEMVATMIGPTLLALGRYAEALPLLDRAGRTARATSAASGDAKAVLKLALMSSLAHEALGDFSAGASSLNAALSYFCDARDDAQKKVGRLIGKRMAGRLFAGDSELAGAVLQLARLQQQGGDNEGARNSIDWLSSMLPALRPAQRQYFSAIGAGVQAAILLSGGAAAQAEPLYRTAMSYWSSVVGTGPSKDLAEATLATANCLADLHRWNEAEELAMLGLTQLRAALGSQHPKVADAAFLAARCVAAQGREELALETLLTATEDVNLALIDILPVLSERQRLIYLAQARIHLEALVSLQSLLGWSSESSRRIYELVLRRKGIALDVAMREHHFLLTRKHPDMHDRLEKLGQLRLWTAQLLLSGAHSEQSEQHLLLASWEREIGELEADLGRYVSQAVEHRSPDLPDLISAIPSNAALIEFIGFGVSELQGNPADGRRYIAFVLRPSAEEVAVVELGSAAPLNKAVQSLRAAMNHTSGTTDQSLTSALTVLSEQLLQPLLDAVGKASHLLLAPDGHLHNLSFEIVPDVNGVQLVSSHDVSYLSTARDLIDVSRDTPVQAALPLVVGAPAFNLGAESGGSRDRRTDQVFQNLPGTEREVTAVAQRLGISPITGSEAVKEVVLNAKHPKILHLATHGCFLSTAGWRSNGTEARVVQARWTMTDCVLAFAGAETYASGGNPPKRAGNGFLSAQEMLALDLSGTELVTLSACGSGLGAVVSGEGVFGLRRALMLAGARSLVVSLWNVPDQLTASLMDDFYNQLLLGRSRLDALRRAQQAARLRNPDPSTWAGFILLGKVGPLDRTRSG